MRCLCEREENGGTRSRKGEELQLREIEGSLQRIKAESRKEGKKGGNGWRKRSERIEKAKEECKESAKRKRATGRCAKHCASSTFREDGRYPITRDEPETTTISQFHGHERDLPDQIIVCLPIPHANYVNTKYLRMSSN